MAKTQRDQRTAENTAASLRAGRALKTGAKRMLLHNTCEAVGQHYRNIISLHAHATARAPRPFAAFLEAYYELTLVCMHCWWCLIHLRLFEAAVRLTASSCKAAVTLVFLHLRCAFAVRFRF